MKKTLQIFILLLTIITNAQVVEDIYFEKETFEEYRNLEKTISNFHSDNQTYGIKKSPFNPNKKYEYEYKVPVEIYTRKNEQFPTGLFIHLIKNSDDNIRYVKYNWGLFNMSQSREERKDAVAKLADKKSVFEKKYNEIYQFIENKLGKPTEPLSGYDNKFNMSKRCKWISEKLYITLAMRFPKNIKLDKDGYTNDTVDYSIELSFYYK